MHTLRDGKVIAADPDAFMFMAEAFVGVPYRWGGDDPMGGFDCSGLVIECLKAAGAVVRHYDNTADGLLKRFAAYEVDEPSEGVLVFWCNDAGKAYHVGICFNEETYIGAEGGGSTTKTAEDAADQNAFVTLRPISSRHGKRKFINLFI